jgi:hypothetical protein
MKIIINESQLRLIVENEDNIKLCPITSDLINSEGGVDIAMDIYNFKKDVKGWGGIKILGSLNYYTMFSDEIFRDINSFLNEIVYISGNLVLPAGDDYELSFNKLKVIGGKLDGSDLWGDISFPELEYVEGNLEFIRSNIETLPKLKKVNGSLHLTDSAIHSLPELTYVGGVLGLRTADIEDLPKLTYVGEALVLTGTPLSKKIVSMSEEERVEFMKRINAKGNILL